MLITGYVLIALSAIQIVANWLILVRWYTSGRRGSMILLIPGLMGAVGCALVPQIGWKFGLVAIALDPGCFSFLGIPNLVERTAKMVMAWRRGLRG